MIKKVIFFIITLIACRLEANTYGDAARKYVDASHATAKAMANALFTNSLIEAYLTASSLQPISNEALEKSSQAVESQLSQIIDIASDDPQGNVWDEQFNHDLLQKLYALRSNFVASITSTEAQSRAYVNQSLSTRRAMLDAFQDVESQCQNGLAVSVLNAGLKMPSLLKNSFQIQVQFNYNTDSGQGSVGGTGGPGAPRGSPEINAGLSTAAMYAAYVGGPVGWAVAAGLASVQYLYDAEEKRKDDIEMSDALMEEIDKQAKSEDVRAYFKVTCQKYLPTFQAIAEAIRTEDMNALAQLEKAIQERQKQNIASFETIRTKADNTALNNFLTKTLTLEDLVDLTMLNLMKSAVTAKDQIVEVHLDKYSFEYYQDVLDNMDQRIQKLQGISFQLSLIAQDGKILERLQQDAQVSADLEQLITDWNSIFAKVLSHQLGMANSPTFNQDVINWYARMHKFKAQANGRDLGILNRRDTLLQKASGVSDVP